MFKKILKGFLYTLVTIVVLVVLTHLVENWRGKRAWESYQRERIAQGDSFEWSSLVPGPVPADQNIATLPMFAEYFPKAPEKPKLAGIKLPEGPKDAGTWREGHTENLEAWREIFKEKDLAVALRKYEPTLSEVTEASKRPYCRFPIQYGKDLDTLPPMIPWRNLARIYRLRALDSLAAGKTEAALEDIQTCLRLARLLKDEPMLLSFMGRTAILELALQPVWEGLTGHRWNEKQLAELQAEIEQIDQFRPCERALRAERLFINSMIQKTIDQPLTKRSEIFSPGGVAWYLLPTGWIHQNHVRSDRFYTEKCFKAADWGKRCMDPAVVNDMEKYLQSLGNTPYTFLANMASPAFSNMLKRVARSQSGVDQAALACALERYRLAKREYPEKLEALVPQFIQKLPADVIKGQTLQYRRAENGGILLYSFGWDGKDDGGKITLNNEKPPRQDLDKGDWAWSQARKD